MPPTEAAEGHVLKVQGFAPGLSSRKPACGWLENASISSECADLDWLVERNHATPAAAPHHHMAALLTFHLKAKTLQGGDDG
jgi:hypothetical protein